MAISFFFFLQRYFVFFFPGRISE